MVTAQARVQPVEVVRDGQMLYELWQWRWQWLPLSRMLGVKWGTRNDIKDDADLTAPPFPVVLKVGPDPLPKEYKVRPDFIRTRDLIFQYQWVLIPNANLIHFHKSPMTGELGSAYHYEYTHVTGEENKVQKGEITRLGHKDRK